MAAIFGRVTLDADRDFTELAGAQTGSEFDPGIAGVTVQLFDVRGNVLASTVTDASGNYAFTGLAAGQYAIRVPPNLGDAILALDNAVGPFASDGGFNGTDEYAHDSDVFTTRFNGVSPANEGTSAFYNLSSNEVEPNIDVSYGFYNGGSSLGPGVTLEGSASANGIVDGEETGEFMPVGYNDANAPTDGGGDLITEGNDIIFGNGGDDDIRAGGGDDFVSGGTGNDFIDGGSGNDNLNGDEGNDDIRGGAGEDGLFGGSGDDFLDGGAEDDLLAGGTGNDDLRGGTGNDQLFGESGNDQLVGGTGADTLNGGDGSDVIYGGDRFASADSQDLNQIVNGSFEDVTGLSGETFGFLGIGAIPGWTTAGAGDRIEVYNVNPDVANAASDGENALDLEGSPGNIRIGQDVQNLVDGEAYQLSFDVTDSQNLTSIDSPEENVVDVFFGGELIATIDPSNIGESDFETINLTLVAGSGDGSDRLEFQGRGIEDGIGVGLDNVQLVPTTEEGIAFARGLLEGSDDDLIFGGAGDDTIFGDAGEQIVAPGNSGVVDANTVAGAANTFFVWDLADVNITNAPGNGDPFASDSVGEDDVQGSTFTIPGGTSPVTVGINDNDNTFEDGDGSGFGSQVLVNPVTLDGRTASVLEIEYSYSMQDSSGNVINVFAVEEDNSEVVGFVTDQPLILDETYTFIGRTSTDPEIPYSNIATSYTDPDLVTDPVTGPGDFGGDDTISGGEGADSIFGEGGNDTIVVSSAAEGAGDVINGGNGPDENTDNDVLDLRGAGQVTINDAADANDAGATAGTVTFGDGSTLTFEGIETILTDNAAPDGVVDGEETGEFMDVGYDDANAPTDGGGDLITEGNDVIFGNGGDDDIRAGGGDDFVSGGTGNDFIDGGAGNDNLNGDDGNDDLRGEAGDDQIFGGAGADQLRGGDGADLLAGGFEDDVLFGDAGNDDLRGEDGDDFLSGGAGDDFAEGGNGNDNVNGDDGNDDLRGEAGDDQLFGGDGADQLRGGDGADLLNGGAENDFIVGGNDDDTIVGGTGDDITYGDNAQGVGTLSVPEQIADQDGAGGDDLFVGGLGADQSWGEGGNDTLAIGSAEEGAGDIFVGGNGPDDTTDNDVLDLRGAGPVTIDATEDTTDAGAQQGTVTFADGSTMQFFQVETILTDPDGVVDGAETGESMPLGYSDEQGDVITTGDDTINGNGGNDAIDASDGDDVVSGGDGDDIVSGGFGDDTVTGDAGNDDVDGDEGNDVVSGGDGDDFVVGGDGNDTVSGDAGNDILVGGDGDDELFGGDGADAISGNEGIDVIDGGAGDDTIAVGGLDQADGGTGDDVVLIDTSDPSADVDVFIDGGSDGTDGFPDGPENGDAGDVLDLSDQTNALDVNFGPDGESGTVDGIDATAGDDDVTFGEIESVLTGAGDDEIDGTAATGPIDVDAGAGDDTVDGGAGDDTLDGGDDDDSLTGGAGDDELLGGAGSDTLAGGEGADVLDGGAGDDDIVLGAGDVATGGDGDDVFTVDPTLTGADPVTVVGGEAGEDLTDPANGGDGDILDLSGLDVVSVTFDPTDPTFDPATGVGESGTVVYNNDAGDPVTVAFSEIETVIFDPLPDGVVNGTDGDDNLPVGFVDAQGDEIDGADGLDDIIDAAGGNDTIDAGLGDDTVDGGTGDDVIEGGEGNDDILGNDGMDTIDGGDGDDTIDGGDDADSITGGDGNDVVEGGDGDDVIDTSGPVDADTNIGTPDIGFPGVFPADDDADSIDGGSGNDTIDGGIDDDVIDGGEGDDRIVGGEGNDTIDGGDGNDTIFAGNDPDLGLDQFNIEDDGTNPLGPDLAPNNGTDTVFGGAGNDTIFGADDADELFGGTGNDVIDGGIDDDIIEGGEGDDTLIGGQGADDLSGGFGSDTFIVNEEGDGTDDVVVGGEDPDDSDVDVLDLTGSNVVSIAFTDDDPATESGVVTFADGGTLTFSEIETVIPCFTPGTLIATSKGERLVEELRAGDRVITRDNGFQEIAWIGQKQLSAREMNGKMDLRPIFVKAGSLGGGLPERDMMLSPNHKVLLADDQAELYFEEREVLVAAKHLVGKAGIHQVDVAKTSYIHFMFERHEIVLSDGVWTESFHPGDYSINGIDEGARAEILALFPELATDEGLRDYRLARTELKKHEARLLLR